MNWTGGRLSRHARANRSLKARQKQHFAKVQARLHNGAQKLSPLKFSFLSNIIESNAGSCHPSAGSNISSSWENQLFPTRQNNSYDLQIPLHTDSHPGPVSHRPQSKDPMDRNFLIRRKVDRVPEADLYSATPLPSEGKRKHDFSIAQTAGESEQDQEEVSQSERRRRVLSKGDWVGVSIQRPLQLAFASSNNVELVGRRKKVTDGHQAKCNRRKQYFGRSPIVAMDQKQSPRNTDGRRYDLTRLRTSDVRISIGGRVVPPGLSSSSIPSGRREQPVCNYHFEQSQASSSDVMLLDNEEFPGRKLRGSEENTYSGIEKPGIYGNRSDRYDRKRTSLSWNSATDFGHDEYEDWSTNTGVSRARKFGSGIRTIGRNARHRHEQPLVSSSTTSLQHPKPQSSRTSLLLRSDSAEITASIVAQVGKVKSIVPSSQVVDNEIWESWVGLAFNEHSVQESVHANGARKQRISISPGISHAPDCRDSNGVCPGCTGSGWEQHTRYDKLSQSPNKPLSISTGEIYRGSSISPNIEIGEILSPGIRVSVYEGLRANRSREVDELVKAPEDSNLDSIWKKFVFGSSDDEIEAVEN